MYFTNEEYLNLPLDEQIEYCNLLFGEYRSMKMGEKRDRFGYFNPIFFAYFNLIGIEVINYDFGIETHTFEKNGEDRYVENPDALRRLLEKLNAKPDVQRLVIK